MHTSAHKRPTAAPKAYLMLPCGSPVPSPAPPVLAYSLSSLGGQKENNFTFFHGLYIENLVGRDGFQLFIFPSLLFIHLRASTFPTLSLKRMDKLPPGDGI